MKKGRQYTHFPCDIDKCKGLSKCPMCQLEISIVSAEHAKQKLLCLQPSASSYPQKAIAFSENAPPAEACSCKPGRSTEQRCPERLEPAEISGWMHPEKQILEWQQEFACSLREHPARLHLQGFAGKCFQACAGDKDYGQGPVQGQGTSAGVYRPLP